jgi:pyrroloquinoline quinone biosynthesis protein B
VNASPDVRQQIEAFLPVAAEGPARGRPVSAVMLTDSQLDHATGLLLLREGSAGLPVYCTDPVREDLTTAFPALRILESYAGTTHWPLPLAGEAFPILEVPGIRVKAIPLAGKAPPYSRFRDREPVGANVALAFVSDKTGKSAVYAPGLAALPDELAHYMHAADVLLLDGTLWRDDEMARAGVGTRTARMMGHLPLSGAGGLLEELDAYADKRRVLVHINNTNPILDEASPEARELAERGIEVALDGLEIEL